MPRRRGLFGFLLGLLLLTCLSQAQALAGGPIIRYVKAGGTGDGTSWASASSNLQAMIDDADVTEVWVAGGLYKPTTTGLSDARTASFRMKNGVAIYGGFVGTETDLTERPVTNPVTGTPSSTTLSGDIGTSGVNNDNSFHVINNPSSSTLNSTAVLDGFVITDGNANANNPPNNRGGGIFNSLSSPTITNCSLQGNSARFLGGGIHNDSSNPTLTNCSLQANSATVIGGGGIANINNSSPTLTNCSLQANSAGQGGGIYNNNSRPTITNCSLQSNSASSGGGVFNLNGSSPALVNCSLQSNSAKSSGGVSDGGGIFNNNNCNPTLVNCRLLSNSAERGGGIANINNSSPTFTNCSLLNNLASSQGGAFYNSDFSFPRLANCVLWDNGGNKTIFNVDNDTFPTATYSLFDNTVTGYNTDGEGNKTTTTTPFASANSVALAPGSPAIDAGSNQAYTTANGPATDLVSNPRTANGTIDMGAIEFQVAPVSALTLVLSASPNTILTTGTTTLSATVSGGTTPYSYTFSGPGIISQMATSNTATVSGLTAGVQTFTVVARDATMPTSQTISGTVSVTVNEANTTPVAAGPACSNYTNKTTANGLGDNFVFGVYAVGTTVYAATNDGVSISTNGAPLSPITPMDWVIML